MVAASFTGCVDSSEIVVEDSSTIEEAGKYSTISRATEYETIGDCNNGGVLIEYGIDENGNGELDDDEVDGDVVVCHGNDGVPGADGQDGKDGEDGQDGTDGEDGDKGDKGDSGDNGGSGGSSSETLLTRIDSPDILLECDAGGRVYSYGHDNGNGAGISSNGILEDDEIEVSTVFCTRNTIGLLEDFIVGDEGIGYDSLFKYEINGNIIYRVEIQGASSNELLFVNPEMGTIDYLDINPGPNSSYPNDFILVDDKYYFTANDGEHGYEMWVTDGTIDGTFMFEDITKGENSTFFYNLAYFQDTFYFSAPINQTAVGSYADRELHKWNPLTGWELVKNIRPGTDSYGRGYNSNPYGFEVCDDKLYFIADDGDGSELWITDGTEEGTKMVKDINPAEGGNSVVGYLTCFNDRLYLRANDGTHGNELWTSDGTGSGTYMVKDLNLGTGPGFHGNTLFVFNDSIFFRGTNSSSGYELWKTDGTEDGTILVNDICPGTCSGFPSSPGIVFGEDIFYFKATDGIHGTELWISDGTESGTYMVMDIFPGSDSGLDGFSLGEHSSTIVNGTDGHYLVFRADDGTFGFETWKSDGTGEGTVRLTDLSFGSGSFYPVLFGSGYEDNFVFFAMDDLYGNELYWNNFLETEIFIL